MKTVLFVLTLAGGLSACTHGPTLSTEDRLALYREHAGAPVNSFRLERAMGTTNWTPLGDQALAVWQGSNRGVLLEMRNRCSGLGPASRISITNSAGHVSARLDSVVLRGTGMNISCRIETIRPIDGSALRDAKRELREAEYIERSAAPPEEAPAP